MQRSEKSASLFVLLCLALSFFSLTLFPASIHTYCENRKVAALLGIVEAIVGAWCLLRKKVSPTDRTLSLIAVIFAGFGLFLSIGFVWYFTHLCHHG